MQGKKWAWFRENARQLVPDHQQTQPTNTTRPTDSKECVLCKLVVQTAVCKAYYSGVASWVLLYCECRFNLLQRKVRVWNIHCIEMKIK